MSNLNTPEDHNSANSDADALYASLLDDIGIQKVPGSPQRDEVAETAANTSTEVPAPGVDTETDFPRTPSVSRSSYVAPQDETDEVASSPAQLPPPGLSASGAPASNNDSNVAESSTSAEPAMFTPKVGESTPRARPSFDEVLYGTSSAHSASL